MTALDAFRQLAESFTIDHALTLIGIGVFSMWLVRTSLGRQSLVHSLPRRNDMPLYVPFLPFFLWLAGIVAVQLAIDSFVHPVEGQQKAFQDAVVLCVVALAIAFGVIVPLASHHFARGLKGFGLRLRTVPRDVGAAFLHLLAVWPLVLAAIVATEQVGQSISQWSSGRDFEMPRHEALQQMTAYGSVTLSVLLAFLAVVVAPLVV